MVKDRKTNKNMEKRITYFPLNIGKNYSHPNSNEAFNIFTLTEVGIFR